MTIKNMTRRRHRLFFIHADTINYYVLFRQEVESLLEFEPQDSLEIKKLKNNMLHDFDHRFPLSDPDILESLLDLRFQNLAEVKRYSKSGRYTTIDFLIKFSKDIISDNLLSNVLKFKD